MSGAINKNLQSLDHKLKDVKERLELVREIMNQPKLNKRELAFNLKIAQSNLTDSLITYLYMESEGGKQ